MEATARLRHLRRSAQKVRLVADLIRMKPVEQALSILRTTPRVCAPDLAKLLESAVANAQQGGNQVDPDALVVASIQVDGAGKKLAPRSSQHMRRSVSNYKKKYAMPRLMSGPQGRVWFIARPLSHVTVVVSDDPAVRRKAGLSPEPPKPQARKKAAGRVAQAVSKAGARPAAKDAKTAKPKAPKAPKGEKATKGGATPDAV